MKNCLPSKLLAALALSALVTSGLATTILAPGFDKLVNTSDYIVRATVKSVTSEWRDNPEKAGSRYIATKVVLDVQEVIKGAPPSPLVLDLVGGKVGNRELIVEGAPKFAVGAESILFVAGNGRQVIPLVGMHHGHYPVRRDKTGQDQVLRSNGQALYSESQVSLPEAAMSVAPAANAQPLTSVEFATRIRKAIKSRANEDFR